MEVACTLRDFQKLDPGSDSAHGAQAWRLVCGVGILAMVLRMLALFLVPEPHLSTNATIAYLGGAEMLVNGKGFGDPEYPLFTPPFYAICIALLQLAFGASHVAIQILQILLDVCTALLLYLLGRKLFSARIGLYAATMWACYPFAIYATLYIGTETMFAFFLLSFLLLLLHGIERERSEMFALAGIILGLATLTRGTTQFLPIIIPGLWFVWRGTLKSWFANCALLILSCLVVILPWSLRNYVVTHDLIPVATAGGVFLWGASDELLTIEERERALPHLQSRLAKKGIERPSGDSRPTVKDGYMVRLAVESYRERLKADPAGLALFMVKKFFRLWYATETGNNHAIILILNVPLYICALVGVAARRRELGTKAGLPLCLLGYFTVLHVVAFPLFRYVLPVMPLLMIYAAGALLVWRESSWGFRPVDRGRVGA